MAVRNPNIFEGPEWPCLVTADHKAGLGNMGMGWSLEILGEFCIWAKESYS